MARLIPSRSKRRSDPEPVEGPLSGVFSLRSKRFAVSALEIFVETRLRRLVPDRASRGRAKRRAIAFTTLKAERVECELTGHSKQSVLSVN